MMRMAALVLLLFLAMAAVALTPGAQADAAPVHPGGGAAFAPYHDHAAQPVDQHGDSRVGVQLVVAGVAAGLVVGVGTGAYLLRRKLGRTAYSPDDSPGSGHH